MINLIIILMTTLLVFADNVPITTAQGDNTRGGANSHETILTSSSLSYLKTLGTFVTDDTINTQPLYVPNLVISGTPYNIVLVGTMNNTVYMFNADKPGSSPLWSTNFGAPWTSSGSSTIYGSNVGIYSTPVIDLPNKLVYVVTVNNTPTYTLRKINLLTGSQISSVDISGSVSGTGAGSSGGTLPFNPSIQSHRTPLTLANGNIYFGFAAINELVNTWHGWVFAYNATTLSQVGILCTTPNGYGGGVWESSGGFTVDDSGNLYFATGNGDWDGTTNFSQSFVKVSPTLSILDYFTPSDPSGTTALDADVSSGRIMIVPGTNYITLGSKIGIVWTIDRTNMGHLQGSGATPNILTVTSLSPGPDTGIYGGLFFDNFGVFTITGGPTYSYTFSSGSYTAAGTSSITNYFRNSMSGTSNGTSNPIVWALTTIDSGSDSLPRSVTLRAFNPTNMTEYWNSGVIGHWSKFVSPTITNGKIFVPTVEGNLIVFGTFTTNVNKAIINKAVIH
jgi:hypothetical protein